MGNSSVRTGAAAWGTALSSPACYLSADWCQMGWLGSDRSISSMISSAASPPSLFLITVVAVPRNEMNQWNKEQNPDWSQVSTTVQQPWALGNC